MNDGTGVAALRREPPAFRVVAVRQLEALTPYMVRVTFSGDSLDGFRVELPAASVRLLLPSPGSSELIIPEWNGNEFLLPGGQRPLIRTFTPRRVDPDRLEIDLDIVIHDGGAVSAWVRAAESASAAAISGPGRGYAIDEAAPAFLVAGDETAIPAISQLLEHLAHDTAVTVIIEIGHRGRSTGSARPSRRRSLPGWFDRRPTIRASPSPAPSAKRLFHPASRCGSPAKRRPCIRSAATSSTIGTSPAVMSPCAGTGSTGDRRTAIGEVDRR